MTLVADITLDGDVLDSAGSNDGTVSGTTTFVDIGPKNAQAFEFDGATRIALDGDTEANFDFDRNVPHSITCWCRRTTSVAGSYWLWGKADGEPIAMQMQVTDNTTTGEFKLRFRMSQSTSNRITNEPINTNLMPLNEWVHVAFTYNGSRTAAGCKYYQNAILQVNDTPIADNLLDTTILNNADMMVGNKDTGSTNLWVGQIADFKVWDTILTLEEIRVLATITNIVADLPLDGDVLDKTGNGNNGTVTGTTTFVAGPKNTQAFEFNNSTRINLANEGNFDFERTDKFSMSCWFKGTDVGTTEALLQKRTSTGNEGYGLHINAAENIVFEVEGPSEQLNLQETSVTPRDGLWHHFVVTYDGSSDRTGMTIYYDSNPTTGSSVTISTSTLNAETFSIGAHSAGADTVDGQIAEVKIYDGELTAAEVKILYNTSKLDILYTIEEVGGLRVNPRLSTFEFNRKISVNMK